MSAIVVNDELRMTNDEVRTTSSVRLSTIHSSLEFRQSSLNRWRCAGPSATVSDRPLFFGQQPRRLLVGEILHLGQQRGEIVVARIGADRLALRRPARAGLRLTPSVPRRGSGPAPRASDSSRPRSAAAAPENCCSSSWLISTAVSESTPYSANGRSRDTSSGVRPSRVVSQSSIQASIRSEARSSFDAAHRPARPAGSPCCFGCDRAGADHETPSPCSRTVDCPAELRRRAAGGRIGPCVDDLQLAGLVLLPAECPLHLAAGSDRQRRLPDQHDRMRIDLVMLDDRAANRLHDLIPIGIAELAVDLVDDDQPFVAFVFQARRRRPSTAPDGPTRPTARCPADSGCGRG